MGQLQERSHELKIAGSSFSESAVPLGVQVDEGIVDD